MKFGKEFRIHLEETLPDWRDKYLCYKLLKKLLKNIPIASTGDSVPSASPAPTPVLPNNRRPPTLDAVVSGIAGAGLQDWFINILIQELDKFNDFYVDKEEEFVIRFQELKERIERVKEKSCVDGILTSESEFSNEMMDIRKDFVTIHGKMVLLKNYSSLNFAGLIKILKKYDKRTGGLLCLPFTQLAFNQPFFTTEPLTRLVCECEEKLELLFPLLAEVVESSSMTHDQMNEEPSDTTNVSSEASVSLGEETVDVYRSTVAAIRTIQGLKKASSTYNPFSFASLFECHDNDSSGAVTAEISSSGSLGALQNLELKNDAQSK